MTPATVAPVSPGSDRAGAATPHEPRDLPLRSRLLRPLLYTSATALLATHHLSLVLPLNLLIVALVLLTVLVLASVRTSRLSILPRFAVVLYSLPFMAMLGYLVNRDHHWWPTPLAIQYSSDPSVINHVAIVGLVGLVGLSLGMAYRPRLQRIRERIPLVGGPVLRPAAFTLLLILSLGSSWLSAPKSDIRHTAYAAPGTQSIASAFNLNSAYLISYVLLLVLYLDAQRERSSPRRHAKLAGIIFALVVIVLYFQLLRGDRESFGLLVAFGVLLLLRPRATPCGERTGRRDRRWALLLAAPSIVVILSFAIVGAIRTDPAAGTRTPMSRALSKQLRTPPGTSILLTNLAISAQHRYDRPGYLLGATYLDYALSIPPGVLTRALGVERRLESDRGPAWWTSGVSAGGSHLVNVPFRNFGLIGVFLVMAGIGRLLAVIDARNAASFWNRLLFGTTLTVLPLWFWYGDMLIVRALIMATLSYATYRLLARPARAALRGSTRPVRAELP